MRIFVARSRTIPVSAVVLRTHVGIADDEIRSPGALIYVQKTRSIIRKIVFSMRKGEENFISQILNCFQIVCEILRAIEVKVNFLHLQRTSEMLIPIAVEWKPFLCPSARRESSGDGCESWLCKT